MIVEEHGVVGASPCECRSTFLETHARLQFGLGEGGAGGAGEKWGSLCCSSVVWSPFPRETEVASHVSLLLFWPWLLYLLEGSDLGSLCVLRIVLWDKNTWGTDWSRG